MQGQVFNFPFIICHFPFVIVKSRATAPLNGKWKTANDKWKIDSLLTRVSIRVCKHPAPRRFNDQSKILKLRLPPKFTFDLI
jgi:hypothetical protein